MKEVLNLLYDVAQIIIQVLASMIQLLFPSISTEATSVIAVLVIILSIMLSHYTPSKGYRR